MKDPRGFPDGHVPPATAAAEEQRESVPIQAAPAVKQDGIPKVAPLAPPMPPPLRHIHKPFFQTYYRPFPSYWASSHGTPSAMLSSGHPSFHEFGEFALPKTSSFQSVGSIPGEPMSQARDPAFPGMYPVMPQNFPMAGHAIGAPVPNPMQPVVASVEMYTPHGSQPVVMPQPPIPPQFIRHGMRMGTWANAAAHDRFQTQHVSGSAFGVSDNGNNQGKPDVEAGVKGASGVGGGASDQPPATNDNVAQASTHGDHPHEHEEDVSTESSHVPVYVVCIYFFILFLFHVFWFRMLWTS